MTTVIGLAPDERGAEAVHLGSMLARSVSDDVVVVTVVPTPWPPRPHPVDAEYLALQEKVAREALAAARTRIGPDLSVELVTHPARSIPSGLLDVARERQATVVALGSPATGVFGRVSLGGVAERILHSADIPVTLAPRGFDTGTTNARISRITVAFGRADKDSDLLVSAAAVAARIGAGLRVACFAVRPITAAAGSIEPSAEHLVVGEWVAGVESDVRRAVPAGDGAAGNRVNVVVGQGGTWADALAALPWQSGEVLAIGTSSSAVSRFFLGSHASKIVRHSPVPVCLWPRAVSLP